MNGSYNINFTMDLVLKDVGLFQAVADRADVALELSPLLIDVFTDAIERYGPRELSPNVIRRLEDQTGARIVARPGRKRTSRSALPSGASAWAVSGKKYNI